MCLHNVKWQGGEICSLSNVCINTVYKLKKVRQAVQYREGISKLGQITVFVCINNLLLST